MARATDGQDQEDVGVRGAHPPRHTHSASELLSAILPFFGSPSPNQAPPALRHLLQLLCLREMLFP